MGKKIIIGCDGTWLNSDDGFDQKSYLPWANEQEGIKATPSNVTRICRALQPRKSGSIDNSNIQIVDYQPGIGSANNFWDHFVNGATAMSIGDNMSAGYSSIVEKWEEGDEIFLLGFSRGAFIARSIAAMIRFVGLLNKKGMEYFYDVFEDWENQNIPGYRQHRYPGKRFDDETETGWCSYAEQLKADGLTRLGVRIRAIGCWDTVGALGVPTLGWRKPTRSFAFVNTEVLSNIDNAFHALALDEQRKPFVPTLWELPDNRIPTAHDTTSNSTNPNALHPCTLRQCWFPGVHSNIGGSVRDAELPNITLAWMVTQLSPFLDFDPSYLAFSHEVNAQFYVDRASGAQKQVKSSKGAGDSEERFIEGPKWGMGFIPDNQAGLIKLAGTKTRTPGRYFRTNPRTGAPEDSRLRNTFEFIHPSVRVRMADRWNGKGPNDAGRYEPPALRGYRLVGPEAEGSVESTGEGEGLGNGIVKGEGWKWVIEGAARAEGQRVELKEERLGDVELMLRRLESGEGNGGNGKRVEGTSGEHAAAGEEGVATAVTPRA